MAGPNSEINTTLINNGKILGLIEQALTSIQTALSAAFPAPLNGSASWTPGSISSGAQSTTTVAVTGASLGSYVQVSCSASLSGLTLTGYVSAANVVTVVLANLTGSPVTIGAVTINAKVVAL